MKKRKVFWGKMLHTKDRIRSIVQEGIFEARGQVVASLDSTGKVPLEQLPNFAIQNNNINNNNTKITTIKTEETVLSTNLNQWTQIGQLQKTLVLLNSPTTIKITLCLPIMVYKKVCIRITNQEHTLNYLQQTLESVNCSQYFLFNVSKIIQDLNSGSYSFVVEWKIEEEEGEEGEGDYGHALSRITTGQSERYMTMEENY